MTEETLQPVAVSVSESDKAKTCEIEVPAGHVLLVALDDAGTDIPGSEFFYPQKSYPRFYGDETKYRVKKKVH